MANTAIRRIFTSKAGVKAAGLSVMFALAVLAGIRGDSVLAKAGEIQSYGAGTGAAEGYSPATPVHHCTGQNDGSDTTDWSYVYFGSYPQTEVKGTALTAAITGASYNADGDARVGNEKYRRISKKDTRNDDFGKKKYRYFKWERIKWRVLKNDGKTLFVIADKGLDCRSYDDYFNDSETWEGCSLRFWLGNEFYNAAFSGRERDAIVRKKIVTQDNATYGTKGGNDTRDKVFLLSIEEASDPAYGFCRYKSIWSSGRTFVPSDYARARGTYTYEGSCDVWLRSPGYGLAKAACIDCFGSVDSYGNNYGHSFRDELFSKSACAPALHITLSSGLWRLAAGSRTMKTPGWEGRVDLPAAKLRAKLALANAVKLSWGKVSGASGYTIYRAASKTGKYKKIASTKKTAYTDKKLKSGRTYYYKVEPYKGKSRGKISGAVSKKIPQPPDRPNIKLTAGKGGRFTLYWGGVKRADKIEIYLQTDSGTWKKWKTVPAKKKKFSYSYKKIKWNRRCAFKVRACCKKEGIFLYSGYSNSPYLRR